MESNQQKMREIIKALLDAMYDMGIDEETVSIAAESKNCHMHNSRLLEVIRNAKSALAEPPRNCDVGTAEEQAYRIRLYCKSHGVDESGCFRCERCQFLAVYRCELAWAQMPYEAKEGGAK